MSTDASKIQRLRAELETLRARYDSGAVAPAVFAALRALEEDVAWREHRAEPVPVREEAAS
jgi:hypothetical protein